MRWLACFALVACGDNLAGPANDSPDPQSGSRLKLTYYAYEDGTRQPSRTQLFDVARNEPCTADTWSDGHLYCAPAGGSTVFTDAACTHERGIANPGTLPAYFIRTFSISGFVHPSRLYLAGPHAALPTETFRLRDGTCESTGVAAADYFVLGDEVARDELVQLTTIELAGKSALAVTMLTSDDGLRLPLAVRDRDLDLECRFDEHDLITAACNPIDAAPAYFFHDAACTEPEAAITTDSPATIVSQLASDTGCTAFFELGTHVGPVPLFRQTGATCSEASSTDGDLYRVGARLTPATAERVRVVEPGHRLQRIVLRDGDLQVESISLFDTTTGVECTTTDDLSSGGSPFAARCFPALVGTKTLFANAGCGVPIQVAEVQNRTCDPRAAFATQSGFATGPKFFAIDTTSPAVYEITTGDRCVPYIPVAGFEVHGLGPELPRDMFPAATLLIDL